MYHCRLLHNPVKIEDYLPCGYGVTTLPIHYCTPTQLWIIILFLSVVSSLCSCGLKYLLMYFKF